MKIAVVIPTIRPESYKKFLDSWQKLFNKHQIELVTVFDGENPKVNGLSVEEVMDNYGNALSNFNGGIRNLGFAYVWRYLKDIEYIITLDDDLIPIEDTIQDHIDILSKKVPISWISTASEYTRGFPYDIREEAEVVLSHGVWEGVADWDAPTQLVLGARRPISFYKGSIPKGIYFPMCSMNLAFKRCMIPYIYHFPWDNKLGIARIDDIWAGIVAKREIDKHKWAAVSGYAKVYHERESNVYKNLINEAVAIELNETFWKGEETHLYFKIYHKKYNLWKEFIKKYE